jgi:hypothetical protein
MMLNSPEEILKKDGLIIRTTALGKMTMFENPDGSVVLITKNMTIEIKELSVTVSHKYYPPRDESNG